jgi:hypothetical protein
VREADSKKIGEKRERAETLLQSELCTHCNQTFMLMRKEQFFLHMILCVYVSFMNAMCVFICML